MMRITLDLLALVIMPFIFSGIILRVKAAAAGRKGQPLLQPVYDFIKLARKGAVISGTTGLIFAAAPVISLVSVAAAAMLVPLLSGRAIAGFEGDFVLFAYLLGLSRFVTLAAAMDTGSSFEGMGASREAAFSALVEPAFFLIMGTAAAVSGAGSFAALRVFTAHGTYAGWTMAVLGAAAMFVMLLAEGSRVPVDDPATHLELTMIHEVMVLDNSGPDMALINYTAALKMLLVCSLAAGMLLPPGMSPALHAAAVLGVYVISAVLTGLIESLMARLRMTHVPQFIFFMSSMALVLFAAAFIIMKGGA